MEYRRAVRSVGRYQTAAGEVAVERTLYRSRKSGEEGRSFAALDRNLGIIDGRWTPMAANDAATISVYLDGVMAPMRDGDAAVKRKASAEIGKLTRGPSGYREVGCGTISFYDTESAFLRTVRMGRMPETKKSTLKDMLRSELGRAFAERPELKLVAVADGANDDWSYLQDEVLACLDDNHPKVAILDFFHATEHISAARGGAMYGDGSVKARTKFNESRGLLLEDPQGVEKVIRSLAYLKKQFPKTEKLRSVLGYLRRHRHMMRYAAAYRDEALPIGSGVIEAACKTLVTQRMKNSGMRWGHEGGQAFLTLRSWTQSDRFDRAWALIAAEYHPEVTTLTNVVRLPVAR